MRAGGAPVAALLLISASLVIQVTSEDLYWEGEEDASNEFLEVKEHDSGIYGRLSRIKREFSFWNIIPVFSSTTPEPENIEDTTADPAGGPLPFDDEAGDGSGAHVPVDPEPKEKTLRVTFVAMQPYQEDYSNRDSLQFQNFSKSLANAVNKIYEEQARNREISGTQRASLVRIQSRTIDDFSCKVTLDIVTIGYYDMDKIAEILRKHIQGRRSLEGVVVSDLDFSANVIDPASAGSCPDDWLRCDAGACLPLSVRCNGELECADGTDEAGCPPATDNKIRDAKEEPSLFGTERSNPAESQETEESSVNRECHSDELQCDYTRCVSLTKRCDGRSDCDDNSDELNCTPIEDNSSDLTPTNFFHKLLPQDHDTRSYTKENRTIENSTPTYVQNKTICGISIGTQGECMDIEKCIKEANMEFGAFVGRELSNVPVKKRRQIMWQIIRIFEDGSA